MKRLTTIICCVALMVAGIATAFQDMSLPGNQTALAQSTQLQWNVAGKLPLDLQLDLDKRQSTNVTPKDSINIIDSVRVVEKIHWKTRYKYTTDRTSAREVGQHPMAANPDSMLMNPTEISTLNREEQLSECVDSPKEPSIQLRVDGVIVYNSEDVIHSTGEGQ